MVDWLAGDVIANGIRIHYYRTGSDKPPVILSHGFSDNGLCWTRVARDLARDYEVILYDHRGHGLSEAPEDGYSSEDRAADLAGLIAALKLHKPRALGHSMGAATVATAAALYPDLLRCAALEDPPWRAEPHPPTEEERQVMMEQRRAEILERKSKTVEELMAITRARQPHWAEEELRPHAESKLQMSLNNIKSFALPRTPWQEIVRKITCPILLITADPEKGGIVTPEIAQEAARLWRKGKVVRISDSGHSIHRDQYGAYMEAVRAFFAEV